MFRPRFPSNDVRGSDVRHEQLYGGLFRTSETDPDPDSRSRGPELKTPKKDYSYMYMYY
eukprot:m.233376 g.233376  ORF g.233376 m.233376 type:complete len:59 (+) comp26088_c2_seq3:2009-2185(+)